MPVVEAIAPDYVDDVTFLAIAWKGTLEDTRDEAARLIPSGNIKWGLDEGEDIFAAYGVPYQPVTVLVTHDDIVLASWPGVLPEAEIRAQLDALVATSS